MSRFLHSVPLLLLLSACEHPQPLAGKHVPVDGRYVGEFMGSPLEIDIDPLRGDSVFGTSRHKDQERLLAGTKSETANGYAITLLEPGDSPYDGRFDMTLDTASGTLTGTWKPRNNPQLAETAFHLSRKP